MGFLYRCLKFEKLIEFPRAEGSIWWRTESTFQVVWSSVERVELKVRIWIRTKQCDMLCFYRTLTEALLIKG